MKTGIRGTQLKSNTQLVEKIRNTIWPSLDYSTQKIYDTAKHKDAVDTIYDPIIHNAGRKVLTIITLLSILYGAHSFEKYNVAGKISQVNIEQTIKDTYIKLYGK
ncbi:MAG: hypothetical protein ACP5NV_00400 [Candidatus Woesearchaeota archaeon]